MRILFLSELGHTGEVPRDYRHMRTEFAQMCALRAHHFPIPQIPNYNGFRDYDHVILLISKTPQLRDYLLQINIVEIARSLGNKVWFMQEATSWIHQTMGLQHQINHVNILNSVDGILSENTTDYKYYRGVAPNTPVHTIPTLMIEDYLLDARKTEKQDKTMIGGNCSEWYGGFDSYLIADIYNNPIDMPKMRNVDLHDQLPRLNVLPHIQFTDWIYKLSEYKYAVHLMPAITAGTFCLNTAFLGIPCIGYVDSDPQRICQPDLSVDLYDIEKARKLANRLVTDLDFYEHCSKTAIKNYESNYSESIFIEYMKKVFKDERT
tara:strand:+ start:282 stop:1244 length:963 start_codon:yes stop_codon:yes gene_type:complete